MSRIAVGDVGLGTWFFLIRLVLVHVRDVGILGRVVHV